MKKFVQGYSTLLGALGIVIVLVVVAGGWFLVKQEKSGMPGENMMEPNKTGDAMMEESDHYMSYASEKLAQAKTGKVVLFFHAPWCPYCRAADKDIRAHLSDIPDNVTILITDYDTSTDLKRKYQVVSQHTFVQVDENGNQITKWSGSETLADILKHLN